MFPPLISNQDLTDYEFPDAIADVFAARSSWMSFHDALARAIDHADNYETDDNGAAASTYEMTRTDRRLFAIAESLDFPLHRFYPYSPNYFHHTHAYVRSDDRGFWDMIPCTATEAAAYLADWVGTNVPTYCYTCDTDNAPSAATCERCGAPL